MNSLIGLDNLGKYIEYPHQYKPVLDINIFPIRRVFLVSHSFMVQHCTMIFWYKITHL